MISIVIGDVCPNLGIDIAPRARASSRSSSSKTAAPSDKTKPSRRASYGREARSGSSLCVLRACIALKTVSPPRLSAESVPPASIRSAVPSWICQKACPMASAPAEQPVPMVRQGPRKPWWAAITAEGMQLKMKAEGSIPSGGRARGGWAPRSVSCSHSRSPSSTEAIAVPRYTPIDSRCTCSNSAPLRPASSRARLAAATANCVPRSRNLHSIGVRPNAAGEKSGI